MINYNRYKAWKITSDPLFLRALLISTSFNRSLFSFQSLRSFPISCHRLSFLVSLINTIGPVTGYTLQHWSVKRRKKGFYLRNPILWVKGLLFYFKFMVSSIMKPRNLRIERENPINVLGSLYRVNEGLNYDRHQGIPET